MNTTVAVSVIIPADVRTVWDEVARLENHVDWMADAERIDFLSDSTSGIGTRMKVATKVGPFRTEDIMEFTAWEPPTRMAIRHQGLVSGSGEFHLQSFGEGTRFTWREDLEFPLYLGGKITALFAKPVLAAIWRRNLDRLADRFS